MRRQSYAKIVQQAGANADITIRNAQRHVIVQRQILCHDHLNTDSDKETDSVIEWAIHSKTLSF